MIWRTTPHAKAFEIMPEKYRTDVSCLKCHATGVGQPTGFVDVKKTPNLVGNSCENCHGPGSKHVALEELWKKDRKTFTDEEGLINERKAIKLTKELAEKQVCARCHDYENSPGFKFPEYWKKIDPTRFKLPVAEDAHNKSGVAVHHKFIMGSKKDMDDVATAVKKVVKHIDELKAEGPKAERKRYRALAI